jgi:hypothetical protein
MSNQNSEKRRFELTEQRLINIQNINLDNVWKLEILHVCLYWQMYIQIYFLASFPFIKKYTVETPFNVPQFKVFLIQFQWSKVNHHSYKFPSTKIFLCLVFKSTALWRNLKWGFHTKCPCLHYLHIACLTFSFDMWTETAVKAINPNLRTVPCRLSETEMKCTFIMCYKYVWKVVTITGN